MFNREPFHLFLLKRVFENPNAHEISHPEIESDYKSDTTTTLSESEGVDDFDVASAKKDQRRKYLSNSFERSRCCKLHTISAPGTNHGNPCRTSRLSRNMGAENTQEYMDMY